MLNRFIREISNTVHLCFILRGAEKREKGTVICLVRDYFLILFGGILFVPKAVYHNLEDLTVI